MIDEAINELTPVVGVRAACAALGESRACHYRQHRKSPAPPKPDRVESMNHLAQLGGGIASLPQT